MKPLPSFLVALGLLIVLGGLASGIFSEYADYEEIKTKCYDRFNNEIEGLTCFKKSTDEWALNSVLICFAGFLIFAFGMIMDISEPRSVWE